MGVFLRLHSTFYPIAEMVTVSVPATPAGAVMHSADDIWQMLVDALDERGIIVAYGDEAAHADARYYVAMFETIGDIETAEFDIAIEEIVNRIDAARTAPYVGPLLVDLYASTVAPHRRIVVWFHA